MLRRGCLSLVGIALVIVGIPMLVCPGPGMLVISAGLALIFTGRLPSKNSGNGVSSGSRVPSDNVVSVQEPTPRHAPGAPGLPRD